MLKAHYSIIRRVVASALVVGAVGASSMASTSILISVPEQRLVLLRDGEKVAQYRISTSRFGLGDKPRSYATPLGRLEVADRLGAGLPPGAVFRKRHPTGEVLPANAKGRDPIVTRILHLRGLEPQNENAFARAIYIHGTPVERTLGAPDSYGCVRMRSEDVIALFEEVATGTVVEIVNERVSRVLPGMLAASQPALPARGEDPAQSQSALPRLSVKLAARSVFRVAGGTVTSTSWATAATSSAQISDISANGHRRNIDLLSVTDLPSLGGIASLHAIP